MAHDPQSVTQVLDRLNDLQENESPTLGSVLSTFGATSFLPMMIAPALLLISPLSGIPLFSSVCGLLVAVVAAQMLMQRHCIWLPKFLRNRHIALDRLQAGTRRLRWLANWLDRHSRKRFRLLVGPPMIYVVQALPIVAGLAIPFMEAIPFSSSLMGAAILCFSLSLLARDGLYVVFGCLFLTIAASLPVFILTKLF
ncbi:exopolysaccharide biosynthesis protein [Parasulfitobacter algicola]|uniref:Exopolysaccharide biosynthesis protein n=1 Tax=Parasulfitobacter algicola TaxID=2614809 RepID=A0ABX2IM41_9RHOB|nr:exopolysaccharide biosynthesis protein [Sulfitobacter algicola]NSX53937.1 exopolysaccharide biosynthesis protein [Sulfitobacter algicola]